MRQVKDKANTIEATIEDHLKKIAEAHNVLCIKAISSSYNGIPDRILIGRHVETNQGVTAFVEVKRPGEKPRALQRHVITTMLRHGATVAITDSFETNAALMHQLFGIDIAV